MRALDIADCINDTCPWSGKPLTVPTREIPYRCTVLWSEQSRQTGIRSTRMLGERRRL